MKKEIYTKKLNGKPFVVTPEFLMRMKKLQGKIKIATGKEPSLMCLTDEIPKLSTFEELENQLIRKFNGDLNNAFSIKLDKNLRK